MKPNCLANESWVIAMAYQHNNNVVKKCAENTIFVNQNTPANVVIRVGVIVSYNNTACVHCWLEFEGKPIDCTDEWHGKVKHYLTWEKFVQTESYKEKSDEVQEKAFLDYTALKDSIKWAKESKKRRKRSPYYRKLVKYARKVGIMGIEYKY